MYINCDDDQLNDAREVWCKCEIKEMKNILIMTGNKYV